MEQLEFFNKIKETKPICVVNDITFKSKKCKTCDEILPIDNFSLCDKHGHRRGVCKKCYNETKQKRKGNFHNYIKEKEYRKELHVLQSEGKRRCRLCDNIKQLEDFHTSNSKKVFYNKKSYCSKCAINVYIKPYQQSKEGKNKKRKWDKKYSSKSESKQKNNKRTIEKYYNDIKFKITCSLRNRVNKALNCKTKKTYKTKELLGCDIEELKLHLERKFKEGMTWENHAKKGWHIDHIIPCASFDLTDPEQQKKCFHYTNLQPLWAKENMSKGAKIL